MGMIKRINIDPNGFCNAKCWFCPVAYLGNPKENRGTMPIEVMENILKQINDGRGDFVDPDIDIYNNPIHYNETLLYPHFEEMVELHKKYNIKMFLFSNGVNFTRDKIDIVKKYPDVITDVILNIPSIEKYQWSKFTGFNPKLFDKLLDNLQYASEVLYDTHRGEQLMILVNGVNRAATVGSSGWLDVLEKAPRYLEGEHEAIVETMQKMFPKIYVVLRDNLSDRTNLLSEAGVISNQRSIKENQKGEVIGCAYGITGEGYPDNEIFISAVGNVYICCNDFSYESVYSNINKKTIKEIWNSQERKDAIKKAYSSMCRNCLGSIWSEGVVPNIRSKQILEQKVVEN